MHVTVMLHAVNSDVTCRERSCYMRGTAMLRARNRHWQQCYMRETGIAMRGTAMLHARNSNVTCEKRLHCMRGTAIFHACLLNGIVHVQACIMHATWVKSVPIPCMLHVTCTCVELDHAEKWRHAAKSLFACSMYVTGTIFPVGILSTSKMSTKNSLISLSKTYLRTKESSSLFAVNWNIIFNINFSVSKQKTHYFKNMPIVFSVLVCQNLGQFH